jgi:hypothetical protein
MVQNANQSHRPRAKVLTDFPKIGILLLEAVRKYDPAAVEKFRKMKGSEAIWESCERIRGVS